MYPQQELIRLSVYKAALRRDIGRRRAECVEAAVQVMKPVEWLDRAWALVRRYSPLTQLAAIPLAFLVRRAVPRHLKVLNFLLRWGPGIFAVVKGLGGVEGSRTSQRGRP